VSRRYKALLAVIVPIVIISLLKYAHNASYVWLMGYMVAVALVFKVSIVSLWLAAQLHFMSFLAGLTIFQGIFLLLKRWLFDSVLSNWIQANIIEHFIDAFKETKDFYLRQDIKTKFRNIFIFIFGVTFTGWTLYIVGLLDNVVVFAELRIFIAGLFTAIVTFFSKIATWTLSLFALSWLAPIVEVFALSYLLVYLEKRLGSNNVILRSLNFIGSKINNFLYYLGILKEKHIDIKITQPIISKSKKISSHLSNTIQQKKIASELKYFEEFENIIMQGHIDAYYSFKGMNEVENKTKLYQIINKKTNNNIDIVAYVSRDEKGNLLNNATVNSFYNDVFLLESYASHKEYGVKVYDEDEDERHINHHDFWVLNTSSCPVMLRSNTYNFKDTKIEGHRLKLIKTIHPFCYKQGDVFCEFKGVRVATTFVDRG